MLQRLEIAANLAVLQFNHRAKAVANVLEEISCSTIFSYGGRMCVRRETEKRKEQ